MLKIKKTKVVDLEKAIIDARNSMNTLDKSDSKYCSEYEHPTIEGSCKYCQYDKICDKTEKDMQQMYLVDGNDLDLIAHHKFNRMVTVYLDIIAPLYWWKEFTSTDVLKVIIESLNNYRAMFLATKDKKDLLQMVQLLPSSYNQRLIVALNYEVLASIYMSHKNSELDEWRIFCDWIESLPYSTLITNK